MPIAAQTFTGVSSYSNDLQSILQRAVSIASLPAQALQNDQKDVVSRQMALTDLRTAASDLQSSLTRLGKLQGGGALTATSSSASVVVTAGSGAATGSYAITEVTSLAKAAVSTLTTGLASASSTAIAGVDHKVEVVVGATTQTLTLTAATDNLNGLRDAINNAHLGVTASVLDTGATNGQRYFLSLTAVEGGNQALEVRTTPGSASTNLLSVTQAGTSAQFKLNGLAVTSKSNLITSAIPGVALQLKATTTGTESIQVDVEADSSPVISALNSFTTAYNAMVDKVDAQKGTTAGTLSGESVINELSSLLRQVSGYRDDGTSSDLTGMGITLGKDGKMTFDSTAWSGLSSGEVATKLTFFGDGTTGLSALADKLAEYTDTASGSIQTQLNSYEAADTRLQSQIDAISERVSAMQLTLMAKLQAADTLLARLESQQNMLTASIDSLNLVTNGKKSS